MKIVFLTTDSYHHWYFLNFLKLKKIHFNAVISETEKIIPSFDVEADWEKNIEIFEASFPSTSNLTEPVGAIWAGKFLHHLKRDKRQKFLEWAFQNLTTGGRLSVIDTDLEYQILKNSPDKNEEFFIVPKVVE